MLFRSLTLEGVTVDDELTGESWTIESLAPGASETFETSYVVTEADILAGGVKNVATAGGESPDPENPEVPVTPGEKDEPTNTSEPSLFVEKTAAASANGGTYSLGEEVAYTIRVTNNGNVTVRDIVLTDDLTGEEWNVESIAPNESRTFTTTYQVTEADILAGSIVNVASVNGTDPQDNPVDAEGRSEITTDGKNSHLALTKRTVSTPANEIGRAHV